MKPERLLRAILPDVRKKIIVCEYCGRILIDKYICDYDGSMQKADLEAAMEAQKKKGRRIKKSEE